MAECQLGRGRSSGPGGQHRNKVETAVTLTHEPTGVAAQAGERRSSMENKRVALKRLRLALATEVRRPVPAGDRRSALWRSRCRDGRITCSPKHADYPAMLAEAMDNIECCGLDHKKAATRLMCTPSQLLKLVQDHPPAMDGWNRRRREAGMHPLK